MCIDEDVGSESLVDLRRRGAGAGCFMSECFMLPQGTKRAGVDPAFFPAAGFCLTCAIQHIVKGCRLLLQAAQEFLP
jgi:hypothetical protein